MKTSVTGAAAAPLPADSVLAQVSGTLGGVLLLILFIAWLARRFGLANRSRGSLLNVRASCSLGARERVVVVEVDNRCLVLGVTSQSITRLHAFTPQETPAAAEQSAPSDFPQALRRVLTQKFGLREDKK